MWQGGAILLVEDDKLVARMLARRLGERAPVRVAHSCAEAVEALRVGEGLLGSVIDLGLPDGSGETVLEAAVARFPGRPALVLTGRVDAEAISRCAALGALYAVKGTAQEGAALDAFAARAVMAGRVDQEQLAQGLARYAQAHGLTAKQERLLREAARVGVENQDLPELLRMQRTTVDWHMREVIRRTKVRAFWTAVRDALRAAMR